MPQATTPATQLNREQEAIAYLQQARLGNDPNEMHHAWEIELPILLAGYQRLKEQLHQA